jgi:hypothetical protein
MANYDDWDARADYWSSVLHGGSATLGLCTLNPLPTAVVDGGAALWNAGAGLWDLGHGDYHGAVEHGVGYYENAAGMLMPPGMADVYDGARAGAAFDRYTDYAEGKAPSASYASRIADRLVGPRDESKHDGAGEYGAGIGAALSGPLLPLGTWLGGKLGSMYGE